MQLDRNREPSGRDAAASAPTSRSNAGAPGNHARRAESSIFNGLGGFAADGREYLTMLGSRSVHAGAVDQRHRQSAVRLPGGGRRRAAIPGRVNSRENQLTPWSNDPVSDRSGEVLYVRDEETGELWASHRRCRSATAQRPTGPARPGLQPL